jgi:uncharacterized membrane protein YedE/YeeE
VKSTWIGLAAGVLFGFGLVVSGMTDPRNIISFLDFTGHWNPNLAFVMAGAIGVHASLLYVTRRRERAAGGAPSPPGAEECGEPSAVAAEGRVDGTLITGAAIFGVGWGLSGYCPAPAIVSLGFGSSGSVVFVVASLFGIMLAGIKTTAPATDAAHVERREQAESPAA